MSGGLRLKVRQTGLNPNTTRAWLDDIEISQGLIGLRLDWQNDHATQAHLTILVDDVDIDAQTIAFLQAWVKERETA